MIIEPGEKIHVVERQFYEGDVRQHFVGIVERCEGSIVRLEGYLYADVIKLGSVVDFVKRAGLRTRVISLDSPSLIVRVLPKHVDIDKITYKFDTGGHIRLTDGSDWQMELSHL